MVLAAAHAVVRVVVAGDRRLVVVLAGPEAAVLEGVGHVARRLAGRVLAVDVRIPVAVVLRRGRRVLDRMVIVGVLVGQAVVALVLGLVVLVLGLVVLVLGLVVLVLVRHGADLRLAVRPSRHRAGPRQRDTPRLTQCPVAHLLRCPLIAGGRHRPGLARRGSGMADQARVVRAWPPARVLPTRHARDGPRPGGGVSRPRI